MGDKNSVLPRGDRHYDSKHLESIKMRNHDLEMSWFKIWTFGTTLIFAPE